MHISDDMRNNTDKTETKNNNNMKNNKSWNGTWNYNDTNAVSLSHDNKNNNMSQQLYRTIGQNMMKKYKTKDNKN